MGEYLAEQIRRKEMTYKDAIRIFPEFKPEIDKYLEKFSYMEIEE